MCFSAEITDEMSLEAGFTEGRNRFPKHNLHPGAGKSSGFAGFFLIFSDYL